MGLVLLSEEGLAGGGGGVEHNFGEGGIPIAGDVLLELRVVASQGSDDVALEGVALPLASHVPEIVHLSQVLYPELNHLIYHTPQA